MGSIITKRFCQPGFFDANTAVRLITRVELFQFSFRKRYVELVTTFSVFSPNNFLKMFVFKKHLNMVQLGWFGRVKYESRMEMRKTKKEVVGHG